MKPKILRLVIELASIYGILAIAQDGYKESTVKFLLLIALVVIYSLANWRDGIHDGREGR